MKHIIYIDSLEKLNAKKDSSLLLALTLQEKHENVYVLFEKDMFWQNSNDLKMKLYSFSGAINESTFYIDHFNLGEYSEELIEKDDVFWMRIDPPFDTRYLRYLWLLDLLNERGVKVINSPRGIMHNNEKLYAYKQKMAMPSFVGSELSSFETFVQNLKNKNYQELVLKPLDLYSGIGVTKHSINDNLSEIFKSKVTDFGGMIVAQPFIKEVYDGEIRSIYFNGKHLGAILKKPKSGEFVSNIAQGATFSKVELSASLMVKCDQIATDLMNEGVPWIAFDALGDNVTEANITCPGLLVEVSNAHGRNLAHELLDLI